MAPTLSRSSVHCSIMVLRHFDPDLGERIGILPEGSHRRSWGIPQQGRQNNPMERGSKSTALESCRKPYEHSM
jgi:hypothetical protein